MNEVPSRHWSLPELVLLQFSNHLTLLPLPPKAHAASAGLAKETNDMKIVVLRRFLSKRQSVRLIKTLPFWVGRYIVI
jgi:hypothetical protein